MMLLGSSSIAFTVSDAAEAVVLEGDYTISNITSAADISFPLLGRTEGLPMKQVAFEPNGA
jgi:hypothetical protein